MPFCLPNLMSNSYLFLVNTYANATETSAAALIYFAVAKVTSRVFSFPAGNENVKLGSRDLSTNPKSIRSSLSSIFGFSLIYKKIVFHSVVEVIQGKNFSSNDDFLCPVKYVKIKLMSKPYF